MAIPHRKDFPTCFAGALTSHPWLCSPVAGGEGGTGEQPLFCVTARTMTASVVVLCACYVRFFCFHPAAVGKKSRILHLPQRRARTRIGATSAREHAGPCAPRGEPTLKARHGHGKCSHCLKIGVLCGVTWLGTAPTPPCRHCCFCRTAPWGTGHACRRLLCAAKSLVSSSRWCLTCQVLFENKQK